MPLLLGTNLADFKSVYHEVLAKVDVAEIGLYTDVVAVAQVSSTQNQMCFTIKLFVTDPQRRSTETQTGNSSDVEFIIDIVSSHSVHNSPSTRPSSTRQLRHVSTR